MIEDCFTQILATAAAIIDPFEQAFFVMAQLPYLQPFDDANERVSRLAANIPLIKANLSPLSFEGLPRNIYNEVRARCVRAEPYRIAARCVPLGL